jgi:hypothetical protein
MPHRDDKHQPTGTTSPASASNSVAGLCFASVTVGTILGLTVPFMSVRSPLPYMATPTVKLRRAFSFCCNYRRHSQSYPHNECMRHDHPTRSLKQSSAHQLANQISSSAGVATTCLQARHFPKLLVDLGSGDGNVVYEAIRNAKNQESNSYFTYAIGIELNFTMFLVSQLRRWCTWKQDEKRRSRFIWGDFLQCKVTAMGESFWKLLSSHPMANVENSRYLLESADVVYIFGVKSLMISLSEELASKCRPGTLIISYRFRLPLVHDPFLLTKEQRERDSICSQSSILLRAKLIYDEEDMLIYECVP